MFAYSKHQQSGISWHASTPEGKGATWWKGRERHDRGRECHSVTAEPNVTAIAEGNVVEEGNVMAEGRYHDDGREGKPQNMVTVEEKGMWWEETWAEGKGRERHNRG